MTLQNILLILLFICLLIDLLLVVFSMTRSDRGKSSSFTLLCGAVLLYTLGYLGEITATTADGVKVALLTENLGIPYIAPLFLVTAICFFAPNRIRKWHLPSAMIYGLIFFCIVLTNPVHNLYYQSITIETVMGIELAHLARGPLYFLKQGLTMLIFLFTYFGIIFKFSGCNEKSRKKKAYFLLGSALPFVGNVINYAGILPIELDLTPFLLTLGIAILAVSMVKYDVLNAVAIARDKAVESMNDALLVLDTERNLLYSNQSGMQFLPLSDEIRVLRADEEIELDMIMQGEHKYYHASTQQIRDKKASIIGWSILLQDITENKRCIEDLERLAGQDALTGQYNRRKTEEMMKQELEVAKRYQYNCAVILFDIDHFKRVNDMYGHTTGDHVLQVIARAVKDSLRSCDIFGRFGGEEFLIFMRSAGITEMCLLAKRLCSIIEKTDIQVCGKKIDITASFGIAEIKPGESLQAAIKSADEAMYCAKEEGRNQVCFYRGDKRDG